jgi:16S rRNA (cytosine967-C5)-methyltransferase
VPISPARQIAFEVLRSVESEGSFASDLLHARLTEKTKREDAALATELSLGVLRRRRLLDVLLERALRLPIEKLDLEVLLALRLGLYQLRYLERVPVSAAVNESVEMVKLAKKRSAASLVNAVLRRAASEAQEPVEKLLPPGLPRAEHVGILHSHPTWLVERWLARFGEKPAVALLEANNRAANVVCAVHDPARRAEILRSFAESKILVKPGRLLREALVVEGGNPARSEAFQSGWISIQDEASQLVPLLLAVERGQSVLDVCAAPGGKTATLARAAGPDALVVAADLHEHRLRGLRTQMKRLGLEHICTVSLDATNSLPFRKCFDRILVDAPCSGTGTLARNPEIRWRLRLADLDDFHRRQVALLSLALEHLAPGGELVYSTCSLEPEENEHVVDEALRAREDVRVISGAEMAARLAPHLVAGVSAANLFDEQGFFRTSPPVHRADGFFAVAMQKKS